MDVYPRRKRIDNEPPLPANIPVNEQLNCENIPAAEDPPDEVIERPATATVPPRQAGNQQPSWFAGVVGAVTSDHGYRLRVSAALLCVLVGTIQNFVFGGYVMSYVLSVLVLDCTLTLWFVWRPLNAPDNTSMLGWLTLAYVPLSFVHPLLPKLFETVCLCVLLINAFIKDIFFVVSCSIISVALMHTMS